MNSYQINMQFPTGTNDLREMYCLDGIVLGFYVSRNTARDFERYYPQYKHCHGVYVLLDNTNPTKVSKVYIGKSDDICQRYHSHLAKTDPENWWQVELAFTGRDLRDGGLKEGYESFLEYYMCFEALQSGQKLPYNSQYPQEPPINMIQKHNLIGKYFKEIKVLTQAVGFPIFLDSSYKENLGSENSITFYCKSRGAKAKAIYDNSRIVVKAGSKIAPVPYKKFPHRDKLLSLRDKTVIKGNIFQTDYPFNSPTEAGNIVSKSTIDGRACWKTKDGKTISDVFDKDRGIK